MQSVTLSFSVSLALSFVSLSLSLSLLLSVSHLPSPFSLSLSLSLPSCLSPSLSLSISLSLSLFLCASVSQTDNASVFMLWRGESSTLLAPLCRTWLRVGAHLFLLCPGRALVERTVGTRRRTGPQTSRQTAGRRGE